MKREMRILGIDDGPFNKFKDETAIIVGVFYRGGNYLDGILSAKAKVDGSDATKTIIKMVEKSKFYSQIQCIMLKGIAVAGFNVIDINKIYSITKIPVIVVMRTLPNLNELAKAIQHTTNPKKRFQKILDAGKIHPIKTKNGIIHCQLAGISEKKAKEILAISTTNSNIPEPLRVAHIIASGIVKGESKGKA